MGKIIQQSGLTLDKTIRIWNINTTKWPILIASLISLFFSSSSLIQIHKSLLKKKKDNNRWQWGKEGKWKKEGTNSCLKNPHKEKTIYGKKKCHKWCL